MQYTKKNLRMDLEAFAADVFSVLMPHRQRPQAVTYLRGLMTEGGRKSAWAMARYVPGGNDQALNHVVGQGSWDFLAVRRRLAERALTAMPGERYLIVDETGFPKKGRHSVGVARQYCGTLGKVGNCQVGVSVHLATPLVSVPLDWDLYLPAVWTDDPARMQQARVPAAAVFRTKVEIALDQLERIAGWGVGHYTVLADALYGNCLDFRRTLDERGYSYLVDVKGGTVVWPGEVPGGPKRWRGRGRPAKGWDYGGKRPVSLEDLAASLPDQAWQEVGWDYGKGPRRSRFYRQRIHPAPLTTTGAAPQPEEWLLMEKPPGDDVPSHFWFSSLPQDTPLPEMVRIAHLRWHVELDYRQLKDELGLDHFEGRSWPGWQRHVTLVSAAYHFLVAQQVASPKKKHRSHPTRHDPANGQATAAGDTRSVAWSLSYVPPPAP